MECQGFERCSFVEDVLIYGTWPGFWFRVYAVEVSRQDFMELIMDFRVDNGWPAFLKGTALLEAFKFLP